LADSAVREAVDDDEETTSKIASICFSLRSSRLASIIVGPGAHRPQKHQAVDVVAVCRPWRRFCRDHGRPPFLLYTPNQPALSGAASDARKVHILFCVGW